MEQLLLYLSDRTHPYLAKELLNDFLGNTEVYPIHRLPPYFRFDSEISYYL